MAKTNTLVLMKTSWRRLEDVFWRRISKANIFVLIKTNVCWEWWMKKWIAISSYSTYVLFQSHFEFPSFWNLLNIKVARQEWKSTANQKQSPVFVLQKRCSWKMKTCRKISAMVSLFSIVGGLHLQMYQKRKPCKSFPICFTSFPEQFFCKAPVIDCFWTYHLKGSYWILENTCEWCLLWVLRNIWKWLVRFYIEVNTSYKDNSGYNRAACRGVL